MGIFQSIKSTIQNTSNLTGYIDTESAEKAIRNNIYFRGPNVWILAVATIIASVGLNVNSIPVVIGAMLISPLMGPIFGLGLGLGVNDMQLMKEAGVRLLKDVAMCWKHSHKSPFHQVEIGLWLQMCEGHKP